jgi:hypothetical protein
MEKIMDARVLIVACLLVSVAVNAQSQEKKPVPRQTYDAIMNDQYAPRIHYYDTDHNGCLDRAVIHFRQDLDSLSVNQASVVAFHIDGYAIDSDFGVQFNLDNDGDGNPDGRNTISLSIIERDSVYDTWATPQLTYNRGVSPIQYETGESVQQIVNAGAIEIDFAPPVLVMVRQQNDGYLQCVFTEPIHAGDSNPGHGFALQNADGVRIAETGHRIEDNILYLALATNLIPWQFVGLSYTPAPPGTERSIAPNEEHFVGMGILQDYWYNRVSAME